MNQPKVKNYNHQRVQTKILKIQKVQGETIQRVWSWNHRKGPVLEPWFIHILVWSWNHAELIPTSSVMFDGRTNNVIHRGRFDRLQTNWTDGTTDKEICGSCFALKKKYSKNNWLTGYLCILSKISQKSRFIKSKGEIKQYRSINNSFRTKVPSFALSVTQ